MVIPNSVSNYFMYLYTETTQSTSKLMTSGSSVPLAIDNTTRQKIRSKNSFNFKTFHFLHILKGWKKQHAKFRSLSTEQITIHRIAHF